MHLVFKKCKICTKVLDSSHFSKGCSKDGLHPYCKLCDKKRARDTRYSQLKKYILVRIRSRAAQRNIPFNLTEEDIILPEYCPILGLKLVTNDIKMEDNSFSVDRIIPSKGYVKGNIQIISNRANRIKCDATIEELEAILNYMKANQTC